MPAELHIVERLWSAAEEETRDDDGEDPDRTEEIEDCPPVYDMDPKDWSPIEREAYWIGSRIREWKTSKTTVAGRPIQYKDIAILLRAARVNAERMAAMLTAMGIPAYAEAGGSLFASSEVRDVVAALETLDNLQQDIPLAAVLRSGIFGERLNEDELVEIRCMHRGTPFHAVVRRYAANGGEPVLRERLANLLAKIGRYREDIGRRPIAEVLWQLYENEGYMARAVGLPNGAQRRANLLKLHSLARRFGSFRRQGLYRFLQFIRSLAEDKQDIPLAPASGESEDVVRIMSVHQSKGLEFPVVFLAGLGNDFNLRGARGRSLFDRESHIGLRAVDTEKMLEYPTAAHRLVVDEIERTTREEEMRILYVAMTRACERLILVGSAKNAGAVAAEVIGNVATAWEIATARAPLDWLLAVLQSAPPEAVHWNETDDSRRPVFTVHVHGEDDASRWRVAQPGGAPETAARRAVARFDPLPNDEVPRGGDSEVEAVLSRLEQTYAHAAATSVRATLAATEFERDVTASLEPEEPRTTSIGFALPPSRYQAATVGPAAQRGIIMHRVLQHMDFGIAADERGVAREVQGLVSEGIVGADETPLVDQAALGWFVTTPLAARIRQASKERYRREFRYLATEPASAIDATVTALDDRVLVRGIVDGILVNDDGLEIVDFKTDAISAEEVAERTEHYRAQVSLYSRAAARLWRRPVRKAWLVFLAPRQTVALQPTGVEWQA